MAEIASVVWYTHPCAAAQLLDHADGTPATGTESYSTAEGESNTSRPSGTTLDPEPKGSLKVLAASGSSSCDFAECSCFRLGLGACTLSAVNSTLRIPPGKRFPCPNPVVATCTGLADIRPLLPQCESQKLLESAQFSQE
jgi:hypothetical protein